MILDLMSGDASTIDTSRKVLTQEYRGRKVCQVLGSTIFKIQTKQQERKDSTHKNID